MEKQAEIVNKKIHPYAEQLIKNKLCHVYPDKILFNANNKSGGIKKQITLAKTSKISPKRREILYQPNTCSYVYIIEFYAKKSAATDDVRLVALICREPLQREPKGEWKRLMETHYEEIRDSTKE